MGGGLVKRFQVVILLCAAASCLALFLCQESHAQDLAGLAAGVPRQLAGFASEGPDATYDRKTIFDYIDGGAEVYLAYDMRGCLSRRYAASGEPAVVLDLFDMGTPPEAFGVFTLDRDGEPLEVGEDGLSREGWIRFWKGRFFVSIYAERETAGAREAALRLARAIEAGIKEKGERPKILGRLPQRGLQKQSIRYLHSHILLETHIRLSDENVLGLGPDTEVALASYVREGKRARLLLVSYPDEARAAAARKRYLSLRMAGGALKQGIAAEGGGGWLSAQSGRFLAIVLDADSRPLAESLLKEAETLP
jgi:hypothetical protein